MMVALVTLVGCRATQDDTTAPPANPGSPPDTSAEVEPVPTSTVGSPPSAAPLTDALVFRQLLGGATPFPKKRATWVLRLGDQPVRLVHMCEVSRQVADLDGQIRLRLAPEKWEMSRVVVYDGERPIGSPMNFTVEPRAPIRLKPLKSGAYLCRLLALELPYVIPCDHTLPYAIVAEQDRQSPSFMISCDTRRCRDEEMDRTSGIVEAGEPDHEEAESRAYAVWFSSIEPSHPVRRWVSG